MTAGMNEITNLLRIIVAILVVAGAIAVWHTWLGPSIERGQCQANASSGVEYVACTK
jgi:hypothetical protein